MSRSPSISCKPSRTSGRYISRPWELLSWPLRARSSNSGNGGLVLPDDPDRSTGRAPADRAPSADGNPYDLTKTSRGGHVRGWHAERRGGLDMGVGAAKGKPGFSNWGGGGGPSKLMWVGGVTAGPYKTGGGPLILGSGQQPVFVRGSK